MTDSTEALFTEKFIKVSDLEVDPRVQRSGLNRAKINWMLKHWNDGAVGVIHVSLRKSRALIILDGWHRVETARIRTDGAGELWCRVFANLTLPQESQMFLDLNRTSQPLLIDKFNVLLNGDGPEAFAAQEVARIVGEYGWKVARTPAGGNINCIGVLQKLYALSMKNERDPNLVQLTIMAITTAWGTRDRAGVEGSLVEGIGAIYEEHGSNLDHGRFVQILTLTEGGPNGLLSRATNMARVRKVKRSMAVADLLMEEYNKGLKTRSLGAWRKR
jgi:hypothetical protein